MKKMRGLRNNNPLNIRISTDKFDGEIQPSQDKAFKQFKTMAYGYRAAFKVLRTYIVKYQCNTVDKIIARWAPSSENDTNSYIKSVVSQTNIASGSKINPDTKDIMVDLVCAMSRQENGVRAVRSDVLEGWDLYITKL